jgi:hypothetical protein
LNWSSRDDDGDHDEIFYDVDDESVNESDDHGVDSVNEYEVVVSST